MKMHIFLNRVLIFYLFYLVNWGESRHSLIFLILSVSSSISSIILSNVFLNNIFENNISITYLNFSFSSNCRVQNTKSRFLGIHIDSGCNTKNGAFILQTDLISNFL